MRLLNDLMNLSLDDVLLFSMYMIGAYMLWKCLKGFGYILILFSGKEGV